MSYIEQNLMNGEEALYNANLHWVVFIWPVIWFFIGIIIIIASGCKFWICGLIFIVLAIGAGLASYIKYTTSEFGLTNKRVIFKVGLIRRTSIEVFLNKVEGIQVDQGIMGRILGYGSITITGTGGTKDPFHKIADPLDFRRKVQNQIALVQESK